MRPGSARNQNGVACRQAGGGERSARMHARVRERLRACMHAPLRIHPCCMLRAMEPNAVERRVGAAHCTALAPHAARLQWLGGCVLLVGAFIKLVNDIYPSQALFWSWAVTEV